jgi:hypothetical protein
MTTQYVIEDYHCNDIEEARGYAPECPDPPCGLTENAIFWMESCSWNYIYVLEVVVVSYPDGSNPE